jgi:hypothetical protein
MNSVPPIKLVQSKIRVVRKARKIWDGFEDATQHYVTTDRMRSYRNYDYWQRSVPKMREHLVRLASDLNGVRSNAVPEMTRFLGYGPAGADDPMIAAKFEFGRTCLIELEGNYRRMEEKAMEAERRRILSYLAQADAAHFDQFVSTDAIVAALGMTATQTKTQLRLLKNDGMVQLIQVNENPVKAKITAEGHRFLEEGPRVSQAGQIELHIGQVVMGDNLGIQASGDRQVVIQQQQTGLGEIAPLVERFIECVNSSSAGPDQKQDAALDAAQLLLEARKAEPGKESLLAKVGVMATWAQALALGPTAADIVDRIRQIVEALP